MARHPLSRLSSPDAAPLPRDDAPSLARALLISLRPEQWTKNLVVFAALLFGQQLARPEAVLVSAVAFLVFCGLSGTVYLVNDVVDRESDRQHPTKRRRPIASGALSPLLALVWAAVLGGAALATAFAIGAPFGAVAVAYLALSGVYTGPVKHIVILDVLTIAFGFVVRAAGGAVAIGVPISHWLLVCTILLALFLALSKRRSEIVLLAEGARNHRRTLEEYSPYLLDQMIGVVTASTLMAYALYTVAPETVEKFGSDRLLFTLPFPIYGIFRYLYLVHRRQGGGSPAEMLLKDRPLLVCVALWALAVAVVIYRPFA